MDTNDTPTQLVRKLEKERQKAKKAVEKKEERVKKVTEELEKAKTDCAEIEARYQKLIGALLEK